MNFCHKKALFTKRQPKITSQMSRTNNSICLGKNGVAFNQNSSMGVSNVQCRLIIYTHKGTIPVTNKVSPRAGHFWYASLKIRLLLKYLNKQKKTNCSWASYTQSKLNFGSIWCFMIILITLHSYSFWFSWYGRTYICCLHAINEKNCHDRET